MWFCVMDDITSTEARLSFLLMEGEPVSTEITFSILRIWVVRIHISYFNWIATTPCWSPVYINYTR